jgi:3-oxoacyl-[acyl-carrier-protein] synthase III
MISYAGFHMAQAAANKVYEKAGVNPKDIRVASCTTASPRTSC